MIIKDMFKKVFKIKNKKIETSLIEEFYYPKYGPGQLWECVANEIENMNGTILKNHKVIYHYILFDLNSLLIDNIAVIN